MSSSIPSTAGLPAKFSTAASTSTWMMEPSLRRREKIMQQVPDSAPIQRRICSLDQRQIVRIDNVRDFFAGGHQFFRCMAINGGQTRVHINKMIILDDIDAHERLLDQRAEFALALFQDCRLLPHFLRNISTQRMAAPMPALMRPMTIKVCSTVHHDGSSRI